MAETPNYHIQLWPEPPGPSTYLCLLCSLKDATEAEVVLHIQTVHEVAAVPTPLAANPPLLPTFTEEVRDARSADVSHGDDR